jgi:uncharacterized membrane-anchored protein
MKYKPLIWALFFALIILQWFFSLSSIGHNENVLKYGSLHKLRLAPVDPRDVLRGEYIQLAFKDDSVATDSAAVDKGYTGTLHLLTFQKDSVGFSVPSKIFDKAPGGSDFLKVEVYQYDVKSGTVNYPFTKWYLQEGEGPDAEARYRKALSDSDAIDSAAYALVKVYNGHGVLEDVVINGQSLKKNKR